MTDDSENSDPTMPVVAITKGRGSVTVPTSNGPVIISRIQDTEHEISGYWAQTSRPCPKSCIQPIRPVEGIVPIAELELLDMLCDPRAIVVDSRTSDWFEGGSIPGAVNIPFPEITDRLDELGCSRTADGWDFNTVRDVALFCNGPWCGQSPTAIRAMVATGFPVGRIHYYRDGMQGWHLLGMTTTAEA